MGFILCVVYIVSDTMHYGGFYIFHICNQKLHNYVEYFLVNAQVHRLVRTVWFIKPFLRAWINALK